MSIRNHRHFIVLVILGIFCFTALAMFFFLANKEKIKEGYVFENTQQEIKSDICQSDGIRIETKIEEIEKRNGILHVNVFSKNEELINQFDIENIPPNHYRPFQVLNCNIYYLFIEEFENSRLLEARMISVINETDQKIQKLSYVEENGKELFYSFIFSVDPNEKYISLIKGYLGSEDYSLVIKKLDTKEDYYVLSMPELFKNYPDYVGDIEFIDWSQDGKYFWFSLYDQAYTLAYVKVDIENRKYDIYQAPEGTMGGDPLNIETGWVTYDDGAPWSGFADIDEEYQNEWLDQGKLVNFKLYNIFTKEEILLEQFSDAIWYPGQKWIDEKTLEYTVPSGEVKQYKVN
ncbi:MAG: hypothetical protein H6791_03500 [Candidatus Nomurabacteria bacterium]|nr:MAG: hypothetical protein H6791_03500 [Candidatus Nomurabacteria bacterium]